MDELVNICCQYETADGKPRCINCGYVWEGEGPGPFQDCPNSPGYAELATLAGYSGELAEGARWALRQWRLSGQPRRTEEQAAASAAGCEACDVPGCLKLHRLATWQCPKIVNPPPEPPLALTPPGQGKTEEQLKAEAVDAMRRSVEQLATWDSDLEATDARLDACAACPTLRWDGCGLPCTCSDLWRKWRERVCSGNCDKFDH